MKAHEAFLSYKCAEKASASDIVLGYVRRRKGRVASEISQSQRRRPNGEKDAKTGLKMNCIEVEYFGNAEKTRKTREEDERKAFSKTTVSC
jgi:hypothetical protein